MTRRTTLRTVALIVAAIVTTGEAAHAQHLPSPGTGFEALLEMAAERNEAGDTRRAARLLLLARARIQASPGGDDQRARIKAQLEDDGTATAARARVYLEAAAGFGDEEVFLGPVPATFTSLADPLIEQVDLLIGDDHPRSARVVLEPVWALDPTKALSAHARIEAIADVVSEADLMLYGALRIARSLPRRGEGVPFAIPKLPVDSAYRDPIEQQREKTALALAELAQRTLDDGFPWVALDIAQIVPELFRTPTDAFDGVVKKAYEGLAKERKAASRQVVSDRFRSAQKRLSSKSWSVSGDTVKFPAAKGKPGLLATKAPVDGDFRLAMDLSSDFQNAPVGLVFAYRSDEDYCAAIFMNYQGRAAVKVEHYVDGEPKRLHWWDGSAGVDMRARQTTWPIAFERHDRTIWIRIGAVPWMEFEIKDLDLSGSTGLYLYEKAKAKSRATASRLEFELLPPAEDPASKTG